MKRHSMFLSFISCSSSCLLYEELKISCEMEKPDWNGNNTKVLTMLQVFILVPYRETAAFYAGEKSL